MELTLHYAYKLFTIKHSEVRVSRRCFERKRPKNIRLKKDARCLLCCCSYHVNTDYILKCLKHPGAQTEIFQGRGGLVEFRHFNKPFFKNERKKGHAGKKFRYFSPRYS